MKKTFASFALLSLICVGCVKERSATSQRSTDLPITLADYLDNVHDRDVKFVFDTSMTISGSEIKLSDPKPTVTGLTKLSINGDPVRSISASIVASASSGHYLFTICEIRASSEQATSSITVSITSYPIVREMGIPKRGHSLAIIESQNCAQPQAENP